jgi:AcrR family transcriptional regulator
MSEETLPGHRWEARVRAPRQRRARMTLERVLDVGAELLRDEGYEGFSITEVCRRAGVSPGTLYERVDGKDDLFLAIHDRELERMVHQPLAVLRDTARWERLESRALVSAVVVLLGNHYAEEHGLLRAFILQAAADPRARNEGASFAAQLEAAVIALLLTRQGDYAHPDPESAVRTTYRIVADTLGWRTAFGVDFHLSGGESDVEWTRRLQDVAVQYLFGEPMRGL